MQASPICSVEQEAIVKNAMFVTRLSNLCNIVNSFCVLSLKQSLVRKKKSKKEIEISNFI